MKKFDNNNLFSTKANDFQNYLLIDKKYSLKTIISYTTELEKFYNFICKSKLDFDNITRFNIMEYINYLKKLKLSHKSINHNLSVIRNFYKFVSISNNISNPMDYIETPKTNKTLPKVLSYGATGDRFPACCAHPPPSEAGRLLYCPFGTASRRSLAPGRK